MGVSGCGKSTIAAHIARLLGAEFLDADDLHPPENKKRMSNAIPLTDEHRLPWLKEVRDHANDCKKKGLSCVIACSALKKSYRDILNESRAAGFVYLDGAKSLIQKRLLARSNHFMPEALLDSQFATLELPTAETNVVAIGIEAEPEQIARDAITALQRANLL